MTNNYAPGTEQQAEEQQNNVIKIQDLLFLCVKNWYWIAISLLVCLSLATIYVLRATPKYTRSASILIKEDKGNAKASAAMDAFADMGIVQSTSNIENEISTLNSPDIMSDVVRRLHLDVSYMGDGTFHRNVLYGSEQPVTVSFPGAPEDESMTFTVVLHPDRKFSIDDMTVNGEDVSMNSDASFPLGSTVKTVVGSIKVDSTPFYQPGEEGDVNVYVVKSKFKDAVTAYSKELSVAKDNEKGTVLNLTVDDASTQRASDILNGVISVYNENWVKDKNQIAVSTSNFINERLGVIEKELGHVDTDISDYKSSHLIPDIQATAGLALTQTQETDNEMLDISNQLQMTNYLHDHVSKESARFQILPVNTGIGSQAIEQQINEYNETLIQRNKLLSNSSENNPLVIDADTRLASMRHSIMTSLENQAVALNTSLRNLQRSASKTTAQLAANPTQAKYLLSVERQQKVKESLYLYLLQKREENELSQAFSAYNTRLIKQPTGDDKPTSPVKRNIFLIAFVVGLAVPVGILFLRETGNTRLRGRKDLEGLGLPLAGEIPEFKTRKEDRKNQANLGAKHANIDGGIRVKAGKRDVVNEAFRVLRTNITFMDGDRKSSVIMVTSFNPGSGKTFITMNTAMALAIKGKRVLVVDCDMRRATLSQYVGSPKNGLANYLSKHTDNIDGAILQSPEEKNLYVLPVGTIPPNPTELLETKRFEELVDTLRGKYDYVFLDCPPAGMMADAQIINQVIDRSLFVLRVGLLQRAMLIDLQRLYDEKKFRNMSMVLNGVKMDNSRYGYSYGYSSYGNYGYGSKGYGYGSGSDDEN